MDRDELETFKKLSGTRESAAQAVHNGIYNLAVAMFESLEYRRLVFGNGHHMAQELAATAQQMILDRWQVDQ
jgi:hypothetical protein